MSAPRAADAARPLRVIHIITDLRIGGAEVQLARLVEASRATPGPTQIVGVVCLRAGGPVSQRIVATGVPVWHLNASGALSFVRAVVALRRLLQDERPDVAIAWLYHAQIALSIPGVAPRRLRQVWNIRGTLPGSLDKLGTRVSVRVSRWLVGRAHAIVYNSATARTEHEAMGYPHAAGLVVPNGYVVPRAPAAIAPRGSKPLVLLAARFHPSKDFATFLGAMRLLRSRGLDVRARLIGNGCVSGDPVLEALLDSTEMRDSTELAGVRSDMLAEYRAATVTCSSSAWGEGFQNVLAEAALAGTPVVSTDVGEARAIVQDPSALVPPGRPDLLADALERILRLSPADQAALGERQAGRLRSEYGVDLMRARYDALCVSQATATS